MRCIMTRKRVIWQSLTAVLCSNINTPVPYFHDEHSYFVYKPPIIQHKLFVSQTCYILFLKKLTSIKVTTIIYKIQLQFLSLFVNIYLLF